MLGVLTAGGLTSKYSGKKDRPVHSRGPLGQYRMSERNLKIAEIVIKITAEISCTPSQIDLNWVRQQPDDVMIPILGSRRQSQLEDNFRVPRV